MLPSDVKYTFHGVPKPPACAASLMPGLARKLYALAITAPSNVAFGGVSPSQDEATNLRLCLHQLSDPRARLYICARTPAGSLARASAYVEAGRRDGREEADDDGDNLARFDEPVYLDLMRRAARLQGAARERAYAELDLRLTRDVAPLLPIGVLNEATFVSARTGCQLRRPSLVLTTVCLKR